MSAIGVGDWVEFWRGPSRALRLGGIYCVEALQPQGESCPMCDDLGVACDRVGVILRGVRVGEPYRAWCSRAFRPIYRPNADLIEQLKQPAPADPVTAVRRMLEASVAAIGEPS